MINLTSTTLVIKIGGGAGIATTHIVGEIAQCVAAGRRIVLLHGGSDLTNTLSEQLGHAIRMITSPSGMTSRFIASRKPLPRPGGSWRRRGFCGSAKLLT